jgi:predicted HTH transcriptional regulator
VCSRCNYAKKRESVQITYNMTPPKFSAPWKYVQVTLHGQRSKERMVELENVIKLKDVTTSEMYSLISKRVEEETLTTTQGEVRKSSRTRNGITNPIPETPTKPDEMKGGHDEEEVLVEDITNQPKSKGE